MPTMASAKSVFKSAGTLFGPGKAANAWGIAVSRPEISHNWQRRVSRAGEVDEALKAIMSDIHEDCVEDGTRDGLVDHGKGANIAGFRKVADAMLSQGAS